MSQFSESVDTLLAGKIPAEDLLKILTAEPRISHNQWICRECGRGSCEIQNKVAAQSAKWQALKRVTS